MARLPRVTQIQFATTGLTGTGGFGAAAAGNSSTEAATSNTLGNIMGTAAFAAGWLSATLGSSKFPAIEDMNALQYAITTQLAYLFQQGIPEWDSGTTYFNTTTASIVLKAGTSQLFQSLTDSNLNNALPVAPASNSNWKYLGDLASLTLAAASYNAIGGCLISSIAGNHTTAALSVGAGTATDSTNAAIITSAGYSWLASNGNAINGTDAGSSTLANSTTYHVFLCSGASGTGSFVSASLTPTFPTGYTTYKRRIGSFNTDGSGNPLPYTSIEMGGGATLNWLTTQVLDITTSAQGTSRIAYTLSVPSGIKMRPLYRSNQPVSTGGIIFTSGDETDVAPGSAGWTTAPGADLTEAGSVGVSGARDGMLTTNTSGQIGARSSGSSQSFYLVTRGWVDFRRT